MRLHFLHVLRAAGVCVAAVLSLASSGCYRMTIVNGKAPPASGPGAMDGKWRSATVLDAVDIDGAAPLDALCKETGWATIRQVYTPLHWLVDVFLAGGLVYESTDVSIHCAQGGAAPANPAMPAPSSSAPGVTPTPSQPPPNQPPPRPGSPPTSL